MAKQLSFIQKITKDLPWTSLASDGTSSSEFEGYIDTGSYVLNAAISGSLFGGMPNNKILALGGDPSTGKTYFVLCIIKEWLDANPEGSVVYFDTESAVTNAMLRERGIDLDRIIKSEPETIEQFRQTAMSILDSYAEEDAETRPPLMLVLDSLGNLSSNKEVEDIRNEKDVRDMTKAQLIKGAFRVLRLRLAKLQVPMIVTNHVYALVGAYVPTKVMGGGQGLAYISDSIAFLSKSKDRDKDKNIVGAIITVKMQKSRLARENVEVDVRISYTGGLDKYYGLLDMAEAAGMVTSSAGRYTFPGHDKTVFASKIAENPTEYFTEAFLRELDTKFVQVNFKYGSSTPTTEE